MARRHGAILRTGQGMLLDETTLCATCWMHGVFAAQLTHRQHLVPQALLGRRAIPTTSSARAGCASWSTRATAGGCSRCPRPSRSGSATAAGSTAWIERTVTVAGARVRRRAGDAVARRGRGRALPVPRVSASSSSASASSTRPAASRSTPSGKRFAFRPDPARSGVSDTPTRSTIWSPTRPMRSRRSAATSCSTPTAGRAAAPTWRCGRRRRRAGWALPSSAR